MPYARVLELKMNALMNCELILLVVIDVSDFARLLLLVVYSCLLVNETVEISIAGPLTCMRWQLVRGVHSSRSVPLGEPCLGEPLGEPYS